MERRFPKNLAPLYGEFGDPDQATLKFTRPTLKIRADLVHTDHKVIPIRALHIAYIYGVWTMICKLQQMKIEES